MFRIVYAIIWVVMWLPLPILYVFSDVLALLAYYVIRYRRKLVRRNLTRSFPTKSKQEIRRLERRFYRSFVDVLVESLYSIHMSQKELKKRFTYDNLELLDEVLQRHQACLVMTSHYGNYEWTTGAKLSYGKDTHYFTIYRALKNKHIDQMMMRIRQQRGNTNIEKNDLLRVIEENHHKGVKGFYGMIADQKPSPRNPKRWYWTTFLNQDTAFLTGTEFLAKRYNYPVLYASIRRVARGRYACSMEILSEQPKDTQEGEITEKYARRLEQDLLAEPSYWLWTHNRWKYQR